MKHGEIREECIKEPSCFRFFLLPAPSFISFTSCESQQGRWRSFKKCFSHFSWRRSTSPAVRLGRYVFCSLSLAFAQGCLLIINRREFAKRLWSSHFHRGSCSVSFCSSGFGEPRDTVCLQLSFLWNVLCLARMSFRNCKAMCHLPSGEWMEPNQP